VDSPLSWARKQKDLAGASLARPRGLADIRFVRYRMFYARPAVNASGAVSLGMRHIRKCHKAVAHKEKLAV
jgi:hypothetical protein